MVNAARVGLVSISLLLLAIALAAGFAASTSRAADDRKTTAFDVGPFDEIHIRGAGNVSIEIGPEPLVEITAPESIARLFTVTVEDGELQGGFGASVAFDLLLNGGVDYRIVTPTLTDLDLNGPMSATLDGLTGPQFDLDLTAAATATLTNIDVADLEVDLDLASTATITGSTDVQQIEAENASIYDGASLESTSATVSLETASTATVRVTGSLSGSVRSASTLNYITENANVDVETATAGSVSQLPYAPLETGSATPAASPPPATPAAVAAPQTWDVTIAQFTFKPATLEIHVGDTVTWTNRDSFPHDVTQLPKGSGFASPTFGRGGSWSYTFDSAGTYDYFCSLHPIMLGTVIVSD